jgi:hypothetical protein
LPLPDLPQDAWQRLLDGLASATRQVPDHATRGQAARFESSPGKFRKFCTLCGSHIVAERVNQPVVLLRLGCLDTHINARPRAHIRRSDAANWYDPKDQIPELREGR